MKKETVCIVCEKLADTCNECPCCYEQVCNDCADVCDFCNQKVCEDHIRNYEDGPSVCDVCREHYGG